MRSSGGGRSYDEPENSYKTVTFSGHPLFSSMICFIIALRDGRVARLSGRPVRRKLFGGFYGEIY